MSIEAIILDIGGVIWLPPETPLSEKWAARCSLDATTFDHIVYASDWTEQALAGAITSEQMWANIGKSLKLPPSDLHELKQDYWEGKWNTRLLDYFQTLKSDYKLGIISDAETGAREAVKEWVNEDLFEVIVFSAEEGICKPDPRIFYSTLKRLGVKASATIFVDDRIRNVEGAKQLGMHAIQYENFSQLVSAIESCIGSDA